MHHSRLRFALNLKIILIIFLALRAHVDLMDIICAWGAAPFRLLRVFYVQTTWDTTICPLGTKVPQTLWGT